MIEKGLEPDVEGEAARARSEAVRIPWPQFFLGLALLATVAGGLLATSILSQLEKNIAEAKDFARPADITLTTITAPACNDCFNVDDAITALKQQNVSIGEEQALSFDSEEARALIEQLGITRVPTYILEGEVAKNSLAGFVKNNGEIRSNAFVFTRVSPYFIDPATKKKIGRVTATILTDPSCSSCLDPKLTVESIKAAGVKITAQKYIVWNSAEGQRLIETYAITKVPALLLSPEIDSYDFVKNNWSGLGTIEKDKTYIARNIPPPYRDVKKGRIVGLVEFVYLVDPACTDCYRPQEVHKMILTQTFGIGAASERTVYSNSDQGRTLISKYKITKVPTILLSPDAGEYADLKNVWENVGTIEEDGWFVFREMQLMGTAVYKDLTNNTVVRPEQQPATNN